MKRNEKMIIIGFMISLLIIGLPIAWMMDTHRPYTETVVLERQYISNLSDGIAGNCENCLIMDVSHHKYGTKSFYFAGENRLRGDLINGYPIKVQWEYIWTVGDYRIRNIYQPTPKDGFNMS